jgi:propionyl-CoA synthetase
MEEILMEHSAVADCAVIAVKDELKGQVPAGLVITKTGSDVDHETLKKELIATACDELGPLARFKLVAATRKLPKTRSGKVLRGAMSKIANGDE